MALFSKKQSTTTNIPELQEYYANQQKDSTGKAWLLAIGSLLVTIVILVGAFFGGRWAYRKVTKKAKVATITTQTDTSSTKTTTKSPSTSSTSTTTKTPSTSSSTTTTTTPTPTATSTTTTTTTPAQGVATTQSTTTNTSATAATTSTSTSKQLTNTGPGNTAALFAVVTAAAYYLHRRYTLYKLNK